MLACWTLSPTGRVPACGDKTPTRPSTARRPLSSNRWFETTRSWTATSDCAGLPRSLFLDINGCWLEAPDDEAYDLVMGIAGGTLTLPDITAALSRWH